MALDIKKTLTTKIGPLPAVVWAAIPAGAYIIYSYVNRDDSEEAEYGDDEVGEAPVEDDFTNGYPSLPGYPEFPDGSPVRPPTNPDPDPYTDLEWSRDAIAWAIAEGIRATTATVAVNAYLYGRPARINSGQLEALNRIITAKGPAPSGRGQIPPVAGRSPSEPPKSANPKPVPGVSIRIARGKVQATWSPSPTPGVTYEVERKVNNGPWSLIARTQSRSASFESGPHINTVRVRAMNKHGYSSYKESRPVKLRESTQPRKSKVPPKKRTSIDPIRTS